MSNNFFLVNIIQAA